MLRPRRPRPSSMAPRAKISLRDFDVGERAGVRGLHYVPDFISPDEERAVLAGIHAPGPSPVGCAAADAASQTTGASRPRRR